MRERIGIFVPVYFREDTVRLCVEGLIQTRISHGYDVNLVFVDNNSNDSLRDYLSAMAWHNEGVEAILLSSNVGKAKAVMTATEKYPDFDWFVNCDSDIIPLEIGWPGLLVDCYKGIPGAGMVASYYTHNGNNPQPPQPKVFHVNVRGKEYTFRWGGGVAGGCFATSRKMWDEIGGYDVTGAVYGGVDGRFRKAVADNGWRCGYIEQIVMDHFNDKDKYKGYCAWKAHVQHRILKMGALADPKELGNDKGFWDK